MTVKTVTKDEAAAHHDQIATSSVMPVLDIATFMRQPFTETDFIVSSSELSHDLFGSLYVLFRSGQLTNRFLRWPIRARQNFLKLFFSLDETFS